MITRPLIYTLCFGIYLFFPLNILAKETPLQHFTVLEHKANEGDSDAQFQLGDVYMKGYLVSQNYTKVITLLEQAAAKGNIYAADALGTIYKYGLNGNKDEIKSQLYFKQAMEGYQKLAKQMMFMQY